MIDIKRINEVRQGEYDETWAIVRSMRNPSPWMRQVQELSPSSELFHAYLALRDAGRWNANAFRDIYVPRFLYQVKHDPAALRALNALYAADRRDGKRVALVCFCPDETTCHRSIVAGLLQGVGANVRTSSGRDYGAYYDWYVKTP